MKPTTKRSILIFIFSALICFGCFISTSVGPYNIPLTIQNMIVVLASCILGGLNGTGAVGIFLVLGTLGLPVFAMCKGGIGCLMGQTGGFLAGYFLSSIVTGLILGTPHTFEKKQTPKNYCKITIAALIGYIIIYVPGILWFIHVANENGSSVSFIESLRICFFPFITADIAKLAVTVILTSFLRPVVAKYMYPPEEDEEILNEIKKNLAKRSNSKKTK